ncbi:MAG TPA: metalloregulator ArsR/SmtB family transcription factor [Ktedonobacterales bacterium]
MTSWRDFTDLKIMLRALGNNTSLNIVHQLATQSDITVTDLVSSLAISQPLVSWHLRNLRRIGLVRTRRRGREVYCSLDTARFAAIQQALAEVVTASSGAQSASAALSVEAPAVGFEPPMPAEGAASSHRPRAGPVTT